MTTRIFFDESLSRFAALVVRELGTGAVDQNLFLRDVSGRLTFILTDGTVSSSVRKSLAETVSRELAPYVDGGGFSVATPAELFDDRLLTNEGVRKIQLDDLAFKGTVKLVDRRMVGADWLRIPASSAGLPLRIVFASLKGGVGRSTALCVVAAHLAARGRRVLTIDMDLEAPGLGNMLLPSDTLPQFGLLDYLVEQSLGPLDDQFYADLVGASWLAGGHGRVDVVPAIGRRSLNSPANVLAKLARAYLASSAEAGAFGFTDHLRALLDRLTDPLRYDVVLIDARAGLHETTAAAMVGLGAEVLLFGLDQPQTFAGYELLLAHLATLPVDESDDWRDRLKFVHAKAPESVEMRRKYSDAMVALQEKYLWRPNTKASAAVDLESLKETFDVQWSEELLPIDVDNDTGPQSVATVLDDSRFRSFNPLIDRDSLAERVYLAAYGDFLESIVELLESSMNNGAVL